MQYDPVTLDIIWNRLISICDEAETGLQRTAFSPQVREGKDFCSLLLDTKGDSIAQGSLSLIIFVSAAPLTAKKMLEKFPVETLEPGDILITNNPWVNAGHLYDVFILEPVFHGGKLIALVASVAHWIDVGGRGNAPDNRSIFEEGLQLPILKIARRGQFNEEVMEIIRENVRFPDTVMGDFRSQQIGMNLIRSKLTELIETQGIEDFGALGEAILARSEAAMRAAIAKVPDGDYENEVKIDGHEQDLTLKIKVSVRGKGIHVDFDGSSPQTELCINSMPNFTYAYTFTGLKAAVAPNLPNNSGQMRPVSMSMPVGSIVNPRPRSVGAASRHVVGNFCCSAIFGALIKAIPQQAQAESAPHDNMRFDGVGADGRRFHVEPSAPCGMGARHNGDGISAIYWPTTPRNKPVEVIEHTWPAVLLETREIRPDSGGAGRYRGGCGLKTEVKIIDQVSAVLHPIARRTVHQAQGLMHGQAGEVSSLFLNQEPIAGLRTVPVALGDCITHMTAGGGGFGDPLEREPGLVLDDILDELVSPNQAATKYGVVIDGTRRIDLEATTTLRRSLRLEKREVSGKPAD